MDDSIPWTDFVWIGVKLAVTWLVLLGIFVMLAVMFLRYSNR